MTLTRPIAQLVSRGLRRDAGIITSPYGYKVSKGMTGITAASIAVNVSDAEPTNIRHAKMLAEHLAERGWTIGRQEDSAILYVEGMPTNQEAAEIRAALNAKDIEVGSIVTERARSSRQGRVVQILDNESSSWPYRVQFDDAPEGNIQVLSGAEIDLVR